jgi:ribose/xylose/arabinose/galactoside ABC-type transport system permease subunit
MIYASRVATAKSNAATGYELVITAVVLVGTSLAGG